MQLVLCNNLREFKNGILLGETTPEDIITHFNDAIQKSFAECKTIKNKKGYSTRRWDALNGKDLWDVIDWTGKLASTKDTNTPDKDDLFRHLKSLYTPANELPIETPSRQHEIYMPITDDPISDSEILKTFNEQKTGYNYTNTILKPFISILLPYMYLLMNTVFLATYEIVKWAPSMLFSIPKKGNLKLVKNWRGIQVGEYINLWYDRILCNRIKLWMNINEFQTAYQRGEGCNTQIFTFRIITELAKQKKKPIYISYVDLEKAFDKVKRSTMLRVLSNLGMGSIMLNALRNIYCQTNVLLKGIGSFISTIGIRQGASSSVYIFIIFINGLFMHLRDRFMESTIYGSIHNLIHADDTLVLDENLNTLKQKVICTYNFFADIDQTVNIGKSKYMCLDSQNRMQNFENMVINGQLVEYTKIEKYLLHYITDDNSLNASIIYDLEERASNVIVKYRNFINNNKTVTI